MIIRYKFFHRSHSSSMDGGVSVSLLEIAKTSRLKACLSRTGVSIQAHPSYLGILQFGQMYNSNKDVEYLKTILTSASNVASTIAIDFRDNIIGANEIFNALPEKEKKFTKEYYLIASGNNK